MLKRCSDPRCPLNKTLNKLQREFFNVHGRPCITFTFDEAQKDHREQERGRKFFRLCKIRDRSNSRSCRNKKCQTSVCTAEHSTSTISRPKTHSHALRKSEMHFHRCKGRPCECRHKRCCKRKGETSSDKKKGRSGKGIRRYRSCRKRKRKCSWLRNCFRRLCICAKPSSSMESNECCCTYRDYGETSNKSKKSRKHISPASDDIWRKDIRLVHKCQCMNSIVENHLLPQEQSYLQGAFSRGLNVMRRSMKLCI